MFDPGMTAPLLAISRHHGIEYSLVLRYADFLVHGRGGTNLPTLEQLPPDVRPRINAVATRQTAALAHAAFLHDQGRLLFLDGRWQEIPSAS